MAGIRDDLKEIAFAELPPHVQSELDGFWIENEFRERAKRIGRTARGASLLWAAVIKPAQLWAVYDARINISQKCIIEGHDREVCSCPGIHYTTGDAAGSERKQGINHLWAIEPHSLADSLPFIHAAIKRLRPNPHAFESIAARPGSITHIRPPIAQDQFEDLEKIVGQL